MRLFLLLSSSFRITRAFCRVDFDEKRKAEEEAC